MFDAYAHLGVPRFQTFKDYKGVMALVGIQKALVCPFDACPDLDEVHKAVADPSGAFRGLGLPLGRDEGELEKGVMAQLDAGFVGLRLSTGELAQWPQALDRLGREGGLPFIVGQDGLVEAAPALLRHFDKYPDSHVIGGHFAGPTALAIFERPEVAELFAHPNFSVVFSRQGIFDQGLVETWAQELIGRLGWDRILWGTEAPVLFWRDEPAEPTPQWIERFHPSPAQREAFFTGNAERLIASHVRPVGKLAMPFDPWELDPHRKSPFYPFGLSIASGIGGRLVHGWLAWGGERRGPLSHYLEDVLDKALPEFEQ